MRSPRLYLHLLVVLCGLGACDAPEKKADALPETAAPRSHRDPNNYSSDCRMLKQEAIRMDSILMGQIETNDSLASKAMMAFTDFAYYCHADSIGPVFLIKTAQVARAVNKLDRAEQTLKYCIAEHPDFRDRPAALFLLAQLYDEKSHLQDRDEAQRLYQQIIEEYPRSDWARSAKGALTMVGKTDEEIIRMLQQKNK